MNLRSLASPMRRKAKYEEMEADSKAEREDEKDEDDEDQGQELGEDDPSPNDEELHTPKGSNMLPDFVHRFEANLREPSRQLAIRDMVINFDPSTVYGSRTGFLRGMLATATRLQAERVFGSATENGLPNCCQRVLRRRRLLEAIASGSRLPGKGGPSTMSECARAMRCGSPLRLLPRRRQ